MKTALIISTYNWPEALSLCLKSVSAQNVFPDEIIVADDGSAKETAALIQKFSNTEKIKVKHIWQTDDGFRLARIRNKAIKNAESDYLIFIDGDIVLHPDFIKDHINAAKPGRFVSGSRVLLAETETLSRFSSGGVNFRFPFFSAKNKLNAIRNIFLSKLISGFNSNIYNVRGCNMAFFKSDLLEINGFDERFTGWGREDSELVYRMLANGKQKYRLKFKAVQYHLYHKENDRSSLSNNNLILEETISRNLTRAIVGIDELEEDSD